MSDTWQSMNGLIQQLKTQADDEEERKRREAEAARQRAQVPVGPLPQQGFQQPVGPITKEQAYSRGWQPQPAPAIQMPQPLPKAQVSRPATNTQVPQISSAQQSPTLPSNVQTPLPQLRPPQPQQNPTGPRFNAPLMNPTGAAPQQAPKWNPQYMPQGMGPSGNVIGNAIQGFQGLLQQGADLWKNPQPMLDAFANSPMGQEAALVGQKIEQRHKEKLFTSTALPNIPLVTPLANQGERHLRLGLDFLDIFGAGWAATASAPTSQGMNIGQRYEQAREFGDMLSGGQPWNKERLQTQLGSALLPTQRGAEVAGLQGVEPGSAADKAYQATPFGKLMDAMQFLDPAVWSNVSNMATYWNASNRNVLETAIAITPAQSKANTPEMVQYANNLSNYMSIFGVDAVRGFRTELLDKPITIADLTTKAQTLASRADAMAPGPMRDAALNEAGRIGAQAAKLRESTPLDLYNKHQNFFYGAPAQTLGDPLQLWGIASEVLGLTPAARRMAKSAKLIENPASAAVNGVEEFVKGVMKTQRSKAMTDAYTVFGVLGNLLSFVTHKGDIATVISEAAASTIQAGIALDKFTGPDVALHAADGIVDFGKSGVLDPRFIKALPALQRILPWLQNLPSLAGDATEIANKFDVQADLLGALTRAGAQTYGVSRFSDVPFMASHFVVEATAGNKAVVKYLDSAKKSAAVLGQSAEMPLATATKMAENLKVAIKTGEEFSTNYARSAGNLMRNIQSTFALNPNFGQIFGNAMGGNAMAALDGTLDMSTPAAEQLSYLAEKMGGMVGDARIATGFGEISPTQTAAEFGSQRTGTYDGVLGNILNVATLGLAKAGRDLRQGNTTLPGGAVKTGENAMAVSIYQTAFRSFFEQEWPKVEPLIAQALQGRVENPEVTKHMLNQLIQAGLSSGRTNVAQVFRDIADGKVAMSVRSISPVIGDVLEGKQVVELDAMLRNLTAPEVPAALRRITEIFHERRTMFNTHGASFATETGRHFYTSQDLAKDVADITDQMQHAATMAGQNPDAIAPRVQAVKNLQEQITRNFLELMQMSQNTPDMQSYLYNVWAQIMDHGDQVRNTTSNMYKAIAERHGAQTGVPSPGSIVAKAWEDVFAQVPEIWKGHGEAALKSLDKVREGMADGSIQASIRSGADHAFSLFETAGLQGPQPLEDPAFAANRLLSDLSVNAEEALSYIGMKVGHANNAQFQLKLANLRKGYDGMRARMFTMLSRFPNENSLDEYLSAMRDIGRERGSVMGFLDNAHKKITEAVRAGDTAEESRWKAILSAGSNTKWDAWWRYAIKRSETGAFRIGEANLPAELMDSLKFTMPNSPGEWKLLGPDILQANQWQVLAPDGSRALFATAKKGVAGVPAAIIAKFNEMRALSERELYEQIGRLSGDVLTQENGAPAVDEWLSRMGDKYSKDMLSTVRKKAAEYMANYVQQPVIPADLPNWNLEKLNQGEQALKSLIGEVANMNSMGHGKLDLSAISDFNRNVLPYYDDVVHGAQDYAKKMVSLDLIDFTNEYHPDVLLGLRAPYHYWWSRMMKNVAERQLFQPKVAQLMSQFFREIEATNRADNQPNRNVETVPWGVTIGDTTYRPGAMVLPRWMPHLAVMAMSGYSNPDRANRAYEYMNEAGKEQGFPATTKGTFATLAYAHELANQMGLESYAGWDALVNYGLTGQIPDGQGALGDMSSLHRTLGYAAVRLANWAKDNNIPLLQKGLEGYAYATVPGYMPYNVGREGSFEAARGNMTDTQAQFAQDVGAQGYNPSLSPLPEQALLDPQAAKQYQELQNKVAVEYFIRNLMTFITGAPIASTSDAEQQLRAAKDLQGKSGFSADNLAGSQTAKFSYTTPGSSNYTPGLAPFESQYAVTAESAPGVPDPNVTRPGMTAAQREYYAARDAIYAKYKDAAQQAYTEHPEWGDRTTSGPSSDFDNAQNAARQLELDSLDKKFPSVKEASAGPKDPNYRTLSGARPTEVVERAQQALSSTTKANVPSAPPGSPPASYDAVTAARSAEATRLMQDPGALLYHGQADAARDIGRHPHKPGEVPTVATQQTAPSFDTGPGSEYASDMTAAEGANGLPVGILAVVGQHESNFTPKPSNGLGMMQIEDAAWSEASAALGLTDREDPAQAIQAAAWYLAHVNDNLNPDKKGNPFWIVAGYNMGVNAVNNMTSPDDILNYDKYGAQRLKYAQDAGEVNGSTTPVAGTPVGSNVAQYTNPNWGKTEGPWTVIGTPITDTGKAWVSPVPPGTEVYQYYGATDVDGLGPYYAKVNKGFGHEGVDYMLPEGTHINSIADGTVVYAGDGKNVGRPAYGNVVVIDHGNGYKSYYGHLSGFGVEKGDEVTAGQYVGDVGHTPLTSNIGSHLHLTVESSNESTGPWNTIDPFRLIGQGGIVNSTVPSRVAPTASVAPSQAPGSPVSPAVTNAAPVSPEPGRFPWGGTGAEILAKQSAANKAPAQVAAEANVTQQYADVDARAVAAYPQGAGLYQEYRTLTDDKKKEWTAAHPLIRAMHLAGYDPNEFAYMEKTWGKGIVEKWANIPPYTGDGDDAASKYYHANPDVFVAKAWLNGRPEIHDDSTFDPTAPFSYDAGKDYDEAKAKFGDAIWDTVRQYYTIPAYMKGGDNNQWLVFKKDHPEYDSWRNWWYEKLGGTQTAPFVPYGQRGGSSYNGFHSHSAGTSAGKPQYINPVEFQKQAPPEFHAPGSQGDWKQWLNMTDAELKAWRR